MCKSDADEELGLSTSRADACSEEFSGIESNVFSSRFNLEKEVTPGSKSHIVSVGRDDEVPKRSGDKTQVRCSLGKVQC